MNRQKQILAMQELQQKIEELIACNSLELLHCPERSERDLYIPYMMNDAVELVINLQDCIAVGDLQEPCSPGTIVRIINDDNQNGLILHRPNDTILTLWYRTSNVTQEYFQYHRIGHFWKNGQEQWRQLVYMIGTIYDKKEYLGTESCNDAERALLPLITFAPFRWWMPVGKSLESIYPDYPDRMEGIQCMERLAKQAGDRHYAKLVRRYKRRSRIPFLSLEKLTKHLAMELLKPERKELYCCIFHAAEQASMSYPVRDYGESRNAAIEQEREHVCRELHQKGFHGSYPFFIRGCMQVNAMEEHPFTITGLDYENFVFRIQFMVCETKLSDVRLNAGFFEGTGRICKDVSEIE